MASPLSAGSGGGLGLPPLIPTSAGSSVSGSLGTGMGVHAGLASSYGAASLGGPLSAVPPRLTRNELSVSVDDVSSAFSPQSSLDSDEEPDEAWRPFFARPRTKAVPPISPIMRQLYIGSCSILSAPDALAAACIHTVVNCAEPQELAMSPDFMALSGVKETRDLPMEDSDEFDNEDALMVGAEVVAELLKAGHNVAVCCKHGMNRSVSVVLTYLVLYERRTLREAYLIVRAHRPVAYPNLGFWRTLISIEMISLGEASVPLAALAFHRNADAFRHSQSVGLTRGYSRAEGSSGLGSAASAHGFLRTSTATGSAPPSVASTPAASPHRWQPTGGAGKPPAGTAGASMFVRGGLHDSGIPPIASAASSPGVSPRIASGASAGLGFGGSGSRAGPASRGARGALGSVDEAGKPGGHVRRADGSGFVAGAVSSPSQASAGALSPTAAGDACCVSAVSAPSTASAPGGEHLPADAALPAAIAAALASPALPSRGSDAPAHGRVSIAGSAAHRAAAQSGAASGTRASALVGSVPVVSSPLAVRSRAGAAQGSAEHAAAGSPGTAAHGVASSANGRTVVAASGPPKHQPQPSAGSAAGGSPPASVTSPLPPTKPASLLSSPPRGAAAHIISAGDPVAGTAARRR